MPVRRSPLALVLLVLLTEAPMHPYRMRELIKERAKDKIVNVTQRNSVYQAIDRLTRDGLIQVHEVTREPGRPERTVYALTDLGAETAVSWLREMLSTPSAEYPDMPAALSSIPLLSPEEVAACLEARVRALRAELAELEVEVPLPRLFLLEDEYTAVLRRAEVGWLESVVADLRSGELSWPAQWPRGSAAD
ncbi:helix-turn-helix transcriptional regulator [Actinokineospora bangkokensis]|uniref:PadR family transcriptional regulator n=1 Tax=Actinokineospora bangkokensis TaxID=1193682 RepID=A0A1Q9LGL6_9PSEU|nr:helix-turn-helix transcriptional regulator [Actinokineospora bangkokensis]OLR91191.1 PadR family transcriptional regulator [Actinokineospora bangkokensis]